MSVLPYDNLIIIIKMRDNLGGGGGESCYLYYKRLTRKLYSSYKLNSSYKLRKVGKEYEQTIRRERNR